MPERLQALASTLGTYQTAERNLDTNLSSAIAATAAGAASAASAGSAREECEAVPPPCTQAWGRCARTSAQHVCATAGELCFQLSFVNGKQLRMRLLRHLRCLMALVC